ncbi:hypothetical protein J1N35_014557 [Gossypium stocksii]|uniref:Uncharacterized protein n=1 Tax=Gossypium stocksii TaxID=47602 RepID=A0A9D3VWR2_9ROSI|nr:hypothetical protein J1N35_014557 [Gossypium stocksii]
MIGRAAIEGSKSNIAMNAWLPQANYPCGRSVKANLRSKKKGRAPPLIHGISKILLKVVVFQFLPRAPTYLAPLNCLRKALKELFLVRSLADTRQPTLIVGAAQVRHQQLTGLGFGPPCPALRANPFPEILELRFSMVVSDYESEFSANLGAHSRVADLGIFINIHMAVCSGHTSVYLKIRHPGIWCHTAWPHSRVADLRV